MHNSGDLPIETDSGAHFSSTNLPQGRLGDEAELIYARKPPLEGRSDPHCPERRARKDLGQHKNRCFPVPRGPSISPTLVEIEFRATGDAPVSRSIANDISECGNLY